MRISNTYNQEEVTLHKITQLIALSGINFLDPLPDDSQNTAAWDDANKQIKGRIFELKGVNYFLAITLTPFEVVLLNEENMKLQSWAPSGETMLKAIETWQKWMTDLGASNNLNTKLHYQLPENELYNFESKLALLSDEFTAQWAEARKLANEAMQQLNKISEVGSEINIWPHHFDTGVYYPLTQINSETTQSIGAGLAIADSMINEPYFYIYGWSKKGGIDYTVAPKLIRGHWITDGWEGAVLPLSDVTGQNGINSFFESSYTFLKTQLINLK